MTKLQSIVIIIVSGTIAIYGIDVMNGFSIYSFGMFPFCVGLSLLISEVYNVAID